MTIKVTIPVAVARAVTGSNWLAAHNPQDADTDRGRVQAAYRRATSSAAYQRKVYCNSAEELRLLLEPVDAVRAELLDQNARAAVFAPVFAFADHLRELIEALDQAEQRMAEEEKRKRLEMREANRRYAAEWRQQTRPSLMEAGRNPKLREICKDYGLDAKDPQVMAGLIAAYHAGLDRYREVVDSLTHAEPQKVPEDQMGQLREKDKEIFERAIAAAHPGVPDGLQ